MNTRTLSCLALSMMVFVVGCPDGGGSGGNEGTGIIPAVVYTANDGSNTVSGFTIGAGGVLTATAPATFATGGTDTQWIAVSANGQFLYLSNQSSANISAYTINSTTGVLTATTPATFSTGVGSSPQRIAVSPNGSFLYVANSGTDEVAAFTIGAGGLLTPTTPTTFSTGIGSVPVGITINPTGQFVYVANSGTNQVAGFTIGVGGVLAPTTPATFSVAPNVPVAIATPGRP